MNPEIWQVIKRHFVRWRNEPMRRWFLVFFSAWHVHFCQMNGSSVQLLKWLELESWIHHLLVLYDQTRATELSEAVGRIPLENSCRAYGLAQHLQTQWICNSSIYVVSWSLTKLMLQFCPILEYLYDLCDSSASRPSLQPTGETGTTYNLQGGIFFSYWLSKEGAENG